MRIDWLQEATAARLTPDQIDELQTWLIHQWLAKMKRSRYDNRCIDCGNERGRRSIPSQHKRCNPCAARRREAQRKERTHDDLDLVGCA